jgi:hypothetical protein
MDWLVWSPLQTNNISNVSKFQCLYHNKIGEYDLLGKMAQESKKFLQ